MKAKSKGQQAESRQHQELEADKTESPFLPTWSRRIATYSVGNAHGRST